MGRSRSYGSLRSKPGPPLEENAKPEFNLTSTSVEHHGKALDGSPILRFKRQCTGDGPEHHRDLSPALAWHYAPEGTESFVLTMVDIDAPDPREPIAPFTHWVLVNIPPSMKDLPEGFSCKKHDHGKPKSQKEAEEGAGDIQEGVNDFKLPNYVGPNPSVGEHRYVISLYALDCKLNVGKKATKEKVEEAMEGHVLDETELVVTYSKEKFSRGIEQAVRDPAQHEHCLWQGVRK